MERLASLLSSLLDIALALGVVLIISWAAVVTIRAAFSRCRFRKEKNEDQLEEDLESPLLRRGSRRTVVLPLSITYEEESTPLLPLSAIDNNSLQLPRKKMAVVDIPWKNSLDLTVNGSNMTLINPDPTMLLSTFLRDTLGLTGTKLGCEEGGCGACTVVLSATFTDASHNYAPFAANACLRPLALCDGYSVTTVEGIGSIEAGMSEEQTRLVQSNGTQCGFCTPGWITAMRGLNDKAKTNGTSLCAAGIQNSLDGNICRCTGYRPIMRAFETFASKTCTGSCTTCTGCSHSNGSGLVDIENCSGIAGGMTYRNAQTTHTTEYVLSPLYFKGSGKTWIRPVTLQQLLVVWKEYYLHVSSLKVQLIAGNTAIGVTKYYNGTAPYNSPDSGDTFVDISRIPEMQYTAYDNISKTISVGGAVTISSLIELLNTNAGLASPSDIYGNIFATTAKHLARVANTQVRNAGTWAGNLMIFLKYRNFASDAVLALTTAGASITLVDVLGSKTIVPMDQFLGFSYENFVAAGYIILSLTIKNQIESVALVTETFKVAQRSRNAHAYVNAGFQFAITLKNGTVPQCSFARIVYGGVAPTVFIASRTQTALTGSVFSQETLNLALQAFRQDMQEAISTFGGTNTTPQIQTFSESVSNAFLYRAMLRCYPTSMLPSNIVSALSPWEKAPSRGIEVFLPGNTK